MFVGEQLRLGARGFRQCLYFEHAAIDNDGLSGDEAGSSDGGNRIGPRSRAGLPCQANAKAAGGITFLHRSWRNSRHC